MGQGSREYVELIESTPFFEEEPKLFPFCNVVFVQTLQIVGNDLGDLLTDVSVRDLDLYKIPNADVSTSRNGRRSGCSND